MKGSGSRKNTQEAGTKACLAGRHGILEATIYNWKAKDVVLDVSEARRRKALEDERGS